MAIIDLSHGQRGVHVANHVMYGCSILFSIFISRIRSVCAMLLQSAILISDLARGVAQDRSFQMFASSMGGYRAI